MSTTKTRQHPGGRVRRQPAQLHCAYCGDPVLSAIRIVRVEMLSVPGQPRVEWHEECAERDPLQRVVQQAHGRDHRATVLSAKRQETVVRWVQARGPGRVSGMPTWWRHVGAIIGA